MSRAVSPWQSPSAFQLVPSRTTPPPTGPSWPFAPYIVLPDTKPSGNLLSLPSEGLLNSIVSPPELSICDFCQGFVKAGSPEELLWCHAIRNENLPFARSLLKFKPQNCTGRGSTDNIYSYRRLSLVLKKDGSRGYWR